jgi:hypothetical protein
VAPRAGGIRGRSEGHGTRADAGEKERGLLSQVADVDYARDPGADGGADSAHIFPLMWARSASMSFLRPPV